MASGSYTGLVPYIPELVISYFRLLCYKYNVFMGTKLLKNKIFHQGTHKVQYIEVSQYVTQRFFFSKHICDTVCKGKKKLIVHDLADC